MASNAVTKVLVVEDDWLVSQSVEQALGAAGCKVVGVATDGADGVEKALSLHPDVVLMDIEMPVLDGISAAKQIQERARVPVILLSAHQSKDLLARASAAGVGAYLIKPAEPREIERAIAVALARFDDLMALELLKDELSAKADALEKALEEVKTLRGIIPICAGCKKVRDDQGLWEQVESYVSRHTEAVFSHGFCTPCAERLYPELDLKSDVDLKENE